MRDINPGSAHSAPDTLSSHLGVSRRREHLVSHQGRLFFQANDGVHGPELWRANEDGQAAMVADIAPGSEGSTPHSFLSFEGDLYFAATTPATGEELFVYDGVETRPAAETALGPSSGTAINSLTAYQGDIYFIRDHQVWKFDGVSVAPVPEIAAGGYRVHSSVWAGDNMIVFNNALFFVVENTDLGPNDFGGHELRSFDGESVRVIKRLSGNFYANWVFDLAVYKNVLHFGALGGPDFNQIEFWEFNGDKAPNRLMSFGPSTGGGLSAPGDFAIYKDDLYFTINQRDMIRYSDGALIRVDNFFPGLPRNPRNMGAFSTQGTSLMYFSGGAYPGGGYNAEPYSFDGAKYDLLANIKSDTDPVYPGSLPSRAIQVDKRLYFYATDDEFGRELWTMGMTFPEPNCLIVVAPIWDNWTLWPRETRTVDVVTYVIPVDAVTRSASTLRIDAVRNSVSTLEVPPGDAGLFTTRRGKIKRSAAFDIWRPQKHASGARRIARRVWPTNHRTRRGNSADRGRGFLHSWRRLS